MKWHVNETLQVEHRLEQSSAARTALDALYATTERDNGSAITVCLGVECVLAFKFDRVHFVPLQAVAIGKRLVTLPAA